MSIPFLNWCIAVRKNAFGYIETTLLNHSFEPVFGGKTTAHQLQKCLVESEVSHGYEPLILDSCFDYLKNDNRAPILSLLMPKTVYKRGASQRKAENDGLPIDAEYHTTMRYLHAAQDEPNLITQIRNITSLVEEL